MTLVREPGSEILAQFTVPVRGTWRNTAINTVPLDAVYDSNNVFVREGKLRRRPGIQRQTQAFPYDPANSQIIIGGGSGVTNTQKLVFAVSINRLYILNPSPTNWVSIPIAGGSPNIATTESDVVDFACLETSSTFAALFAFTSNPLKVWTTGGASIASVTGTNIPNAKSICIAASRVIALVDPHTVVWSRVLNYTNFDALAIVKRAQTTDVGICVRALSALSFVLYKEYSIHTARAQAGLDEGSAFSFSEPIIAEGPAGIYAVVDVNGTHIYMTKSGRIAIFDGTNYPRWIADGIWFFLQEDILQELAFDIRGVYDYRLNIVVFFYPRQPGGVLEGMVIINLPFSNLEAEADLQPYAFLGTAAVGITHACTKRFDVDIERAFLFNSFVGIGVPNSCFLSENETSDNGITTFQCSFQTGLQAAPDARHVQTTTESFLERAIGNGTVDIIPVTSNSLETPGGTVHTADAQTINLETAPVNEYIGFNKKTRFFGFKYVWSSLSDIFYSGTVVYDSIKRRQ